AHQRRSAPDDLLAPVTIVLAIVTALTGLLLCGLGLARAGAAIRFVPYPVIGGFLGATGWLMIGGAVRVITDHPLSFATLEALIEAYERLKSENRPLHQALLSYVVTVMAERLGFASKVIGVLRR